ncbi:orotidine-5'-phosphate decarboxylase [Salisaeta longa]|uniref:orotidine-5'-phosphate decarboxylase n=1 Tax=Salisaeta longa TaxID=503170 RepID=UPI0003B5FE08|nr:orotidine-5'-phosphate decarboxylase [Salisaeta longa]
MPASFNDRLRAIQTQKETAACVGLDPDPARLPAHLRAAHDTPEAVRRFCRAIIEATAPFACAFKPNLAFFEALGRDGRAVLEDVVAALPSDVLVIADAKRGDIGNSARFYAQSLFDDLGADAVTVAPYMGHDSVTPFLQHPGTAAFVLARTSNPGASDFQEACQCNGTPLHQQVAEAVQAWARATPGTGGLVVGATAPDALRTVRTACPTAPFLIPGVGAQGGTPAAVMAAAATADGPVLVNSSRSILYASAGRDFADAAAAAAQALRDALRATPAKGSDPADAAVD